MKKQGKKIIAGLLSVGLMIGGGFALTGCFGGGNPNDIHQIYCSANNKMLSYRGSVSYQEKRDGKITALATYNYQTAEYASYTLANNGEIMSYEATKLFGDEIGFLSNYQTGKIVDKAFVCERVSENILEIETQDIEDSYDEFMEEINEDIEERKQQVAQQGGLVNDYTYSIEYSSLSNNNYKAKIKILYDVQDFETGSGVRMIQESKYSYVFSTEWISSVEIEYKEKTIKYENNNIVSQKEEEEKIERIFSKTFYSGTYSQVGIANAEKPTIAQYTYLTVVYNGNVVLDDEYLPFNVDLESVITNAINPSQGEELEFYLNSACTSAMPEGYKLNSVEDNTIYVKTKHN